MPLFRYKALAETGRAISGVIDADSQTVAKDRLRKQKVMVTSIGLLKDNKKEIGLDRTLLLSFTKELGQLLRAGLPVYESLLTLEEKYRRHKSHSPLFRFMRSAQKRLLALRLSETVSQNIR